MKESNCLRLLLFSLVSFNLSAAVVPATYTPSIMKVIIDGSELTGEHVSSREYRINKRYFLSPSFVNADFTSTIEKLESMLQKKKEIKSALSRSLSRRMAAARNPASVGKRSSRKIDQSAVLLEYVTLGNGKRMVTNIAVPN